MDETGERTFASVKPFVWARQALFPQNSLIKERCRYASSSFGIVFKALGVELLPLASYVSR